jgi:hypothetical protein
VPAVAGLSGDPARNRVRVAGLSVVSPGAVGVR